jgi:hypothetical protein
MRFPSMRYYAASSPRTPVEQRGYGIGRSGGISDPGAAARQDRVRVKPKRTSFRPTKWAVVPRPCANDSFSGVESARMREPHA